MVNAFHVMIKPIVKHVLLAILGFVLNVEVVLTFIMENVFQHVLQVPIKAVPHANLVALTAFLAVVKLQTVSLVEDLLQSSH